MIKHLKYLSIYLKIRAYMKERKQIHTDHDKNFAKFHSLYRTKYIVFATE